MAKMTGYQMILKAAASACRAIGDASSDPSSCVAVALTVLRNNAEIEARRLLNREVSSVIEMQNERAVELLRLSGYLVTGD